MMRIGTHPKYPGFLITCDGSVYSLKARRWYNGYIEPNGYLRYVLDSKKVNAHVLVLETFICARPTNFQAAHNNGIKLDNRLENLRWATPLENQRDRQIHGTHNKGFNNGRTKLTRKDIIEIKASKEKAVELARLFGVSDCTIHDIRKGKRWTDVV